ncbi:MAG: hypothetical protein MRK00_14635 [Nitrosomonas sp.]|nr:hypothetical protein [Nitrosomonas sp.]
MDAVEIDWSALESVEQVEHVLTENLSKGSRETDVYRFASRHGLECSERVQSVIYCSVPASGKWKLIREKWLMEFHLCGDSVKQIKVSKGYIGP